MNDWKVGLYRNERIAIRRHKKKRYKLRIELNACGVKTRPGGNPVLRETKGVSLDIIKGNNTE